MWVGPTVGGVADLLSFCFHHISEQGHTGVHELLTSSNGAVFQDIAWGTLGQECLSISNNTR